MKYNWNVYGLMDKMDSLNILKRKTQTIVSDNSLNDLEKTFYENILKDIENDIAVLETIIKDDFMMPENTKKLLTIYEETKNQLLDVKNLWTDIKEAKEITNKNTIPAMEEKYHTLSKQDLVDLTYDFFRNALDRRLYGNFMKSFYRKNDHLRFFSNDFKNYITGSCYPLNLLKENYISIKRDYTLNDLLTLIHEYMHATSFYLNSNHFAEDKSEFSEIDSMFSELIAVDYLKKHLPNYKLDFAKCYMHNDFCTNSDHIAKAIRLIEIENDNYEITNNKTLKRFSKGAGILDFELESLLLYSQCCNSYVIGYMYAVEFYKLYERDRDLALNTLEKFIMYDGKNPKDYIKYLRGSGIIANEHMREHHNEVQDTARKLSQK